MVLSTVPFACTVVTVLNVAGMTYRGVDDGVPVAAVADADAAAAAAEDTNDADKQTRRGSNH